MKFISKTFRLLPLLFVVFAFNACSDDDDATPPPMTTTPNIVELAASSADLTTLVTALQIAPGDLDGILTGSGPFTVLAPTNQAFQDLLDTDPTWNDLTDIPGDVLQQVLLNHVISADLTAADLAAATSPYASTNADGAGGENLSIYFDTTGGVTFNGISSVIDGGADLDASNGTVHIVDAVITLPSIVDHASANGGLSELVDALTDENLVGALQADGPFTVFAPTNDAFTNFGNPNQNALSDILLNHVVGNTAALSTGLMNMYVPTLAQFDEGDSDPMDDPNLSLYINTDSGVTFNGGVDNGGADVVPGLIDIVATNGVIHVVDGVIDLPTVVNHAIANPGLSSLVAALTEADGSSTDPMLIPTLSGDGPFTVFAPVNDAFQALLDSDIAWDDLTDIPDDLLNSVLLHHVLNDNIRAGDLSDGVMPATLEGDMITINLPQGENPMITDSSGNMGIEITATDVQGINGVAHVINGVLIPDTTN
ncbi:MAG: fasciclin domain-containing protein [Bacteroidota bacterium]